MSYISIYRKYRPQSFSDVVGQDEIIKTLKNSIKSDRIAHAYMFCGPRGTGKTTTARIFAKAINCLNNRDENGKILSAEPCNNCENCINITNGSSVDVIEIDAASNNSIDNVRELIDNARYLPNFLRKKVYIIDEIQNLGGGTNKAAFHALLKLLEEPPEYIVFIMATTEPQKIIPTIISRCQRFDFRPIKIDKIKERLKIIASKENIEVSDNALSLISKYADGSQRDANVILEKLASLDNDKIRVEDVKNLLGAVDLEILFELADIIIEKNVSEILFFVNRLEAIHQNLEVFTEKFIEHLQNIYFIKNNPSGFDFINVSEDYREKYENQAKLFSNFTLNELIQIFTDLLGKLRYGQSGWVVFKSALLKAISFKSESSGIKIADKNSQVFKNDVTNILPKIEDMQKTIQLLEEKLNNLQNDFKKKSEILILSQKANIQEGHIISKDYIAENKTRIDESKDDKSIQKDKPKEVAEEKTVKATIGKNLKSTGKHGNIDVENKNLAELVIKKWPKILLDIKRKSIPLHSQLMEVRKFKVKEDEILFYLLDNYGWHKEKLNENDSSEKIRDSIKAILGVNFKIGFYLESEGDNLIDIKSQSEIQELISDKKIDDIIDIEKSSDVVSENSDFKKFVEPGSDKTDTYEYLKKKFKLKEKKSGN